MAGAPLEIHPPDGFTAKQSSPDADEVTTYDVANLSDPGTGCTIDFVPAKDAARRDQRRINLDAAKLGYFEGVKASLADLFDVTRIGPFTMQGADGAMAVAIPKAGEGSIRSWIFVVEVPRGEVKTFCVASADEFDAWRPVFEKVARGVVLPR